MKFDFTVYNKNVISISSLDCCVKRDELSVANEVTCDVKPFNNRSNTLKQMRQEG